MHTLSCDIETYSRVDLQKSGLYKYAESPDFKILLFAYSLDSSPVQLVDLAQGETLPDNLIAALRDPEYIKHAYNAAFEWYCLSRVVGPLPINQWRCTMLHSLYCGYAAGLGATGSALGLPQERQKQRIGGDLIRYFCVPCKPTKCNGQRTRNLPHHDPDKWQLFRDYCIQDVVTEMAVDQKLAAFPVPAEIQRQWEQDLRINSRGVAVDADLVAAAIVCGRTAKAELTAEAVALSEVGNPNSTQQLTEWLEGKTGEKIPNLQKSTVKELLKKNTGDDSTRRILQIRQELGKISIKKYDTVDQAVCGDGRVRGMLQFYGANRTGRWAGRIIQLQNLPRSYFEPLPLARELIKERKLDHLRIIYGNVFETLSQLIRTAFVAPTGKVLVDADFSAIEARVLAWLAGEQWKLDVFQTHGKIYEASASQMFGVPIDLIKKGNPEYELRQRGKVAELGLGYGMGASKFKDTAESQYGVFFTEEEAQDIVWRWRKANSRIQNLWYAIDAAAMSAVKYGTPTETHGLLFARECDPANSLDFVTITIPSGRKLFYAQPFLTENRWGKEAWGYCGMNRTTRKWEKVETYGAKLTENIVQAIARDCLAEAIDRMEAEGLPIVFHVHDELVAEAPEAEGQNCLDKMIDLMSLPMPWAKGLPLAADGWVGPFYKKN